MQPRKDYDDYTRFINDTFSDNKDNMLNKTVSNLNRTGGFKTKGFNPMDTLRTYSDRPKLLNISKKWKGRNMSFCGDQFSATEQLLGSTLTDFDVKPKILESKVSQKEDFFALSDGFKRIFSTDKKDEKLVIPIAGYGGHRRGDRSQNFFGKSFRETSL